MCGGGGGGGGVAAICLTFIPRFMKAVIWIAFLSILHYKLGRKGINVSEENFITRITHEN
jgi:hypothetical protein